MAQIIWTAAAVEDLNRIADYLFDREAAKDLVKRAILHVGQLETHPLSGPRIPELRKSKLPYRQLVEPPLRIFYKYQNDKVYIVHIIRGERQFSKRRLTARDREL